jgi:signal peptidase I
MLIDRIMNMKRIIRRVFNWIGIGLTLPVYLPKVILKSKAFFLFRFLLAAVTFLALSAVWAMVTLSIGLVVFLVVVGGGLVKITVPTQGPSMMPTFNNPDKTRMRMYVKWLYPDIKRGDIVTFENEKVDLYLQKEHEGPAEFIKRVVAIPGDRVEIKNGFVYLNGQPIREPYILKDRSTFGGDEIKECQQMEVPEGKVLVMGDNRKRSADSRAIGLVDTKNISFIEPTVDQSRYQSALPVSGDEEATFSSLLDPQEYVKLLNQKRVEAGVKPLKYQPKLEKSAEVRGKAILETNDFSFEATKSGMNMSKAMSVVGYSNIVYGESKVTGYYEASELMGYLWELPEYRKFLLENKYQEVGVGSFVGKLNGCPVQIVVTHMAGYVPPNYPKEVVESWRQALVSLQGIKSGWADLKNSGKFYDDNKSDVDRINEIISIRISNVGALVKKMQSNQWLSKDEEDYMTNKDKSLGDEQAAVAKRLNGK